MSYKRLAIAVLTVGLVATSIPPANAAIKAGAKCTSAKLKIIDQGLTYTCLKSGKKLKWSKGVEPLEPTSFSNLEQNAKSVAYWAWKKSSQQVSKSNPMAPNLVIHIGPNSVILNDKVKTSIELVSRLYPRAKAPKEVNFLYYGFKDVLWAQSLLDKLTNYDPNGAGEAAHNCNSEFDCAGGSARTSQNGIAVVMVAVQIPLPSDSNHLSGTLEAHEYTHSLQSTPSVGTSRSWGILPRWYIEGGATFAQAASIYYASYSDYLNERDQLTRDLSKGDWLTEKWLDEFISPTDSENWNVWEKYPKRRVYDIGSAVTEILTALKGPDATMELIDLVAEGSTFSEAFEKIYQTKWLEAVPIISKTILKEYKN
jgi:hypothetical protein